MAAKFWMINLVDSVLPAPLSPLHDTDREKEKTQERKKKGWVKAPQT